MTPPTLAMLSSLVGHRPVWPSTTCFCATRNAAGMAEMEVRDPGNLYEGSFLLFEICWMNAQVVGGVCHEYQFWNLIQSFRI
jgi:hypothetical protein